MNLAIIEHKGNRVLTTAQLAEVYETDGNNIVKNFSNNKDRFIEGRDYHVLTGAELKAFKDYVNNVHVVPQRSPSLYLWTDRGANRHSKILDTDKAWQQFDVLEETYFKAVNFILPNFNNPVTAARAWADAIEAKNVLEIKVATMEPKAKAFDVFIDNNGYYSIGNAAKMLGTGQKRLFGLLRSNDILMKNSTIPYQKYIEAGYFAVKAPYETPSHHSITYVSPKGIQWLSKMA